MAPPIIGFGASTDTSQQRNVVLSSSVTVDGEERPARVHFLGGVDMSGGLINQFFSDVVYFSGDYLGSTITVSTHAHADNTVRDERLNAAINSVLAQVGAFYPAALPFTSVARSFGAVAHQFLPLSRPTDDTRIAGLEFVSPEAAREGVSLAEGRYISFDRDVDQLDGCTLHPNGALSGGSLPNDASYMVVRIERAERTSVARSVRQQAADSTALVLEQVTGARSMQSELPLVSVVELAQAAHYFGAVQRYRQLQTKQRSGALTESEEQLRRSLEDDPVIRNLFGLDPARPQGASGLHVR